MDCREFRNHFSLYVDDALDAADEVRCRRHVAACEGCRRLEAAYHAGVAALRELDPLSPARDLSVRILHRARREPRIAILAGGYGLAGALLLVILAGVVAFDLREHREARAMAALQIADTSPAPAPAPAGGLDIITVRMREVPGYGPPANPYVVLPATDPDPASRFRFDFPAVWSGR